MTFFLTGHPPHDNETRRWHWGKRSREMKIWREAAKWACREAYGKSDMLGVFKPVRIHVRFLYRVHRTRDVANLIASLKPVIDGMVDARMLRDDGPTWLPGGPSVEEVVNPRGKVGIEVTITEVM